MFCSKILTNVPFMLTVLIFIMEFDQHFYQVGAATVNLDNLQRPHRPISRSSGRIPIHYGKNRPSLSDFLDDDDLFDMSKRQVTDDYGHLRFGKRGEDFDDYGHLRFGRSSGE